jgi:stage II sporulation protein D
MISIEPVITVGIFENKKEVEGSFDGAFELPNSVCLDGRFRIVTVGGRLALFDDEGVEVIRAGGLFCRSISGATCTLDDVRVGIDFHWDSKESQTFEGDFSFIACEDGTIAAVNRIGIESYLKSVISSEMNAEAPGELLKAHAITSRSWLVAMLERKRKPEGAGMLPENSRKPADEIIRWYDRNEHKLFDVCADDHCQRYQGITKDVSKAAENAVRETRGVFLAYGDEICDARFSKACGGRTESFEHCWEDIEIPYLQSISDSPQEHPPVVSERDAERWILTSPDAYCDTSDRSAIDHILPSIDRTTTDFFRWKVEYAREELEEILKTKSGIDFGTLKDIVPMRRGPSGRIFRLMVVGTKRTVAVGKELEIRRWLSKTHLYSSAFIVKMERDADGIPERVILHGAGWGHGVGLCQIGAATMAARGFKAEEILMHYFRRSELKRLY